MAAPPPPPPPGPGGKIGGPPPPPPPSSSSSLGGKKSTGKSLSDVLSLAKNRSETADSESSLSRTPAILRGEQAFAPRPEHGHAGLFNQGSTCYMNSLLQALYMTPSFRDALTSWRTGKEIEEKNLSRCIPYQFQRLFARLKFSSKASINTKDITRSFGWEGSDIFQQQDANELRLVLFDALEKSFDHYKTSNVIDTLFRGSVNNVRKCSSCSHEKKTPEPYLDLNLPVRGIGSLEESLSLFLQQEKLEGVLCSECDNRCDADLGIQISSVPTVLTLSLRRFDYDTITWRRVKLGHRVSFPFSLDMSPFITTETKTSSSSSSSSNEKENYIYELFGVLIHSGGAMGGHYYSFMRDLESGKWLSFDDANVRLISEEDIESAFGTSEGSKGSSITGGGTTTEAGRKPGRRMGCAYMLVYHLRHKIPKKMSSPQYPPDVMSEVKEENSVFEKEKEEYEIRRDTVHLKVFVTGKERERIVGVYNKRTVKEGITEMYKDCAQNDLIDPDLTPQDCVRLRDYNASTNTPGKAYNSSDDRNILQAGFVSMRTFLLEVKGKDEDFPEVQAPQVTIKVRKYNESGDSLDPIIILSLPSDAPLLLLRETLAENKDINIPVAKQRLVRIRENDCSTETIAGCDEMTLESLGIGFAFSVYVESILEGKPSGLLEYLEGQKHIIEIQYSNDTDKQKDQGMKILLIDDRKTIRELKGALSAETGVATNKFLLCRRGLKAEYKNGDLRLCDADIFSGMQLSMIAGQPLGSNQYKFKVFLYNPPKESPKKSEELLPSPPPTTTPSPSPADGSPGGPPPPPSGPPPPPSGPPPPPIGGVAAKSLEFTMLGEAVIDIGMTVDEVRNEMRSQEYGEKVPQFFRLREKLGQQMGQVLKGGALFGSHYKNMRSGMELAVQGLSSDDHLGPEDLLVSARQWLPEDWKLGDRIEEIVLEDTATVQDLKERFSLIFDIPLAFIAIARPGRAISPFQVATANWDPMEDLILTGSPWYMKSGDAIVVKDRRHKDKHEIPVSMMRETGVTITTDFEEQLRLAEQLSLAEQ